MASTVTVRGMNQEIIRNCLKGREQVSKTDLAALTGLSFPTVSRTIDHLVNTGEVETVGAGSSSGGRCAMLYRLNPLHAVYLLLTIERGRLRWKLKDLGGNVLAQASRQGEGRLWEAIGETAQSIKGLYPQLRAVVIGAAGMVSKGRLMLSEGDQELEGRDLEGFFSERLSRDPPEARKRLRSQGTLPRRRATRAPASPISQSGGERRFPNASNLRKKS